MEFVKITTSDIETRWLNLRQISRVTLTQDEQGNQLLVVIFQDHSPEMTIQIHGSDDMNRHAIEKVTAHLDEISA
ncbi:MAG: hypothetical protein ACYTGQ_11675 [Planctomycetota bacterium]|jgi:hypothetical protein